MVAGLSFCSTRGNQTSRDIRAGGIIYTVCSIGTEAWSVPFYIINFTYSLGLKREAASALQGKMKYELTGEGRVPPQSTQTSVIVQDYRPLATQ